MRKLKFACFILLALLAFSGIASALCTYTDNKTDCDVVSVTIRADATEYDTAQGGNIILTINVKANTSSSPSIGNVDVTVTRFKQGSSAAPVAVILDGAPFVSGSRITLASGARTATATVPISGLQTGVYSFSATITQVNGTIPYYDYETSNNLASTYATIKKQTTQVPEVHPVFILLIAFSILFIAGRKG